MLFDGLQSLKVLNYLVNSGRIDGSKLMMIIAIRLLSARGFPGGSEGKESACNAGDLGSIPGSGRSPEEGNEWHPTPVLLPGKSHEQRSLVYYSPWDRKESDMTERLHFHFQLNGILTKKKKKNPHRLQNDFPL